MKTQIFSSLLRDVRSQSDNANAMLSTTQPASMNESASKNIFELGVELPVDGVALL